VTTLEPVMEHSLSVADGPHWRDGSSLARMQATWLLALAPAAIAAVAHFGVPALRVMSLAVGTAVTLDAIWNRLVGGRDPVGNWSSVTLGLLLALLLPVNAPWWLVVTGCGLLIVVGKKLFGGWGGYAVHPVALTLAMLTLSWPARLDYTAALAPAGGSGPPIEAWRLVKTLGAGASSSFAPVDLLLGYQVGGVGNGLVLWLLLGGVLLVLVRQVPWQIPLGFLGGVVGCAWFLNLVAPGTAAPPLFQVLAGSTVLTAFFLAPEQTTSPVNPWPMIAYGGLGGGLLVLIRAFSSHYDGVIFAVLLMNICSPLLDRVTPPVPGREGPRHA
jgi:electron transport complex protein RnfD